MNRIKKLQALLHALHLAVLQDGNHPLPHNGKAIANSPSVGNGMTIDEGAADPPPDIEPSGYGPNPATLAKLDRLRVLRRDSIRNGRVLASWTAACRQVGIDPKTARKHDPELRAHWDDPAYGNG